MKRLYTTKFSLIFTCLKLGLDDLISYFQSSGYVR